MTTTTPPLATTLAASLGLRCEQDGAGWRWLSPSGVPLYWISSRALAGRDRRVLYAVPILDLAAAQREEGRG